MSSDRSLGPARADALALRRVRVMLRSRERPAVGELAYRAYFAVMLVIVVAAPALRALLLWLVEVLPAAHEVLPAGLTVLAGSLLIFFVMLVVVGWYAMLARMSLPELDLLFTSSLPRWRLLLGRVVRLCIGLVLAGAAFAGLLLAAWMLRGDLDATAVAPVLIAGAVVGLCAAAGLLLGQRIRGTRWQVLREQALQLDVVSALVFTGEFRSAAGRMGAPVRAGRRWHWAQRRWLSSADGATRSGAMLIASRDLLGIARTPARSLAALFGMMAAGMLVVSIFTAGGAGAPAALAPLLAYACVGPWCRGLRVAGESVGAPPLLPFSSLGLLLRHLVVPAALSALICGGTAAVASGLVFGLPFDGVAAAAILGVTVSLFAMALRLLGALKGPLPQRLLAPIPTPAGDLSSVNVLLWNLDGPILAAAIGVLLALLIGNSPWVLSLAVLGMLALLIGWCAIRLRATEGWSSRRD